MAKKPKANKAGHPFIGKAGGISYYINDIGEITDEDGKHVGTGYQKVLLQQFPQPEPEVTESKEVLEEAFPETYEEPRTKKRRARKKNSDIEQKEAAEKLAAEYKRDIEDLKSELGAMAALMREDTALIRQQLTVQQRSITLLTEIAKNITGGGNGINLPNIGSGFGWKSILAAALGAGALGAVGGYFLNDYLSEEDETDAAELVPEEKPPEPPQQTAGIKEAQERGDEQKPEILTINARELSFNSDKLKFEVNELTIDADNIKTEGRPGAGSSGGGGGGGSTAPTGNVGGAKATGAASGAFNPTFETPSSPSGTPGQMLPAGKGAFQGFSGKAPTSESVKEDLTKARSFTPMQQGAGDLKGLIDQSAAAAGIDPRKMYGIVAGESLHRNTYDVGDNGKSFGPFQLYTGGGLGNEFQKETGLNPADPKTLPAQAKWVANYLAKHPNMNISGTWHGYKGDRDWDPSWGNAGYTGPEKLEAKVEKVSPAAIPAMTGMFGDKIATPTLQPVPFTKTPVTSPETKASISISSKPLSPEIEKIMKESESVSDNDFDLQAYKNLVDNPLPDENISKPIDPYPNAPMPVPRPKDPAALSMAYQAPATSKFQTTAQEPSMAAQVPSIDRDKSEELPGWVPSSPKSYFGYLFPDQQKINIGIH